eukprot:7221518-Pyramimonas_sp.AAC.1
MLPLPGARGGPGAIAIIPAELEARRDAMLPMGPTDRDTCQEKGARGLVRAIVALKKASRRRADPCWSSHGAMWLPLFRAVRGCIYK